MAFSISKLGFRLGLADIPNERSAHDRPIPKGGGIGIPFAAGLAGLLFVRWGYVLIAIALFLAFISLINDRFGTSVSLRLLLEAIFAAVLLIYYKKPMLISGQNKYSFLLILAVLVFSVIYIVASANFFNFMDGINGIAGFEAIISFTMLAIYISRTENDARIALLCLSVAAASFGFLLFNFPTGRVFMGDVGSIFLGFLFACFVVLLSSSFYEFLLLASFQSLFYIDCLSTIAIRSYRQENIFQAHKQHFYQQLVHAYRWTHVKVTIIFAVIQGVFGMMGILLFQKNPIYVIFLWVSLLLIYWTARIKLKLVSC